MTKYLSNADDLAALVPDGATIIIAKDPAAPTALAGALIRRGAQGLHLITLPTGAYVSDLLIGAGCVTLVETSGVSLGENGAAGRFVRAVKSGALAIKDSTCPAIYAAVQAGEKGQPFAPMRGLIGSDIMRVRPDYRVIDNPFAPGDPIAVLPAIRPDIALMHADLADRFGNVWVSGRHEIKSMTHAAKQTLVTVEEIIEGDLRLDPTRSANLIGGLYVTAVAEAKGGAWPTAAPGRYEADTAALAAYAIASRSDEGFGAWLADHVGGVRVAAE
jgi:glutaconate CoA-transferase subunit A